MRQQAMFGVHYLGSFVIELSYIILLFTFSLIDIINNGFLLAHILPSECSNLFPFQATPGSQAANHSQAMLSNLLGISCFVAIARWMYLRKIFINV